MRRSGDHPEPVPHDAQNLLHLLLTLGGFFLVALDLLENVGEPLMTSTLMLPDESLPMTDPYEINTVLGHQLDLVIDGGFCGFEGTTVVDLTQELPMVTRQGAGDASAFSELA